MTENNIYIDGSCINNGKKDARAGYAIYFANDDPRNENSRVMGKQSNNTGELTALIRAIEKVSDDINNVYNIHTDSEYVIKCITSYGKKQAEKGWVENIKNKNLVKRAYELYTQSKNIKINYIQAHTGLNDIHSLGNAEADRLAKLSIGLTGIIEPKIIILDWITYENKDKAKKLGAMWNIKKKYWYVYDTVDEDILKELEKLKETVIKLPWITIRNKDKAKELGAHWNSKEKYWYVSHSIDDITMKKLIDLNA